MCQTKPWERDCRSFHEIVQLDVQAYLEAIEAVVPDSQYRLKLLALSDDACRKFHQDRTFQRLIITYRGGVQCGGTRTAWPNTMPQIWNAYFCAGSGQAGTQKFFINLRLLQMDIPLDSLWWSIPYHHTNCYSSLKAPVKLVIYIL